ncbi:serine/threonine protein kinase [Aquimonas sp.]|jgi:hypothetical protein|uniref:serine/threonine protein kinase n=1 Tax=Aquimonas sp. TaxID=1872588 RepID=UPI0037BFDAF1
MSEQQIPGYHIEGELGRGGMASVFRARQESLHRSVAIKVMMPSLGADADFKARFLNEGRIIAQLSHPHIVTVYDIGSHGEQFYLSMELLPGGTLRDRIGAGLSLSETLRITQALAGALHYAHRRGFVHRDVKPMNVLFRDDGTPVLTDFGIAKVMSDDSPLTRTGFAMGSVGYMSPEQSMGRPIDQRADVYAFGVLFWQMLTGAPPFEATDAFALALKHATADLPPLPPEFARFMPLMQRALAKQPEERYSGLDVFLLDLAAVCGDLLPGTGAVAGAALDAATTLSALQDAPTRPLASTMAEVDPEATIVRRVETVAASAAGTPAGTVIALGLVERELSRLLIRLPDYIEALRIPEPAHASKHLRFCDDLLRRTSIAVGDYLQVLGARSMDVSDFERLNTAMDRHARLGTLTNQLVEFSQVALMPTEGASVRALRNNMIEGLDAILLTLQDAVRDADLDSMAMVREITGDRSDMMQNLRQSYLTDETRALGNNDKLVLLKLTGQFERLVWALGAVVQRL